MNREDQANRDIDALALAILNNNDEAARLHLLALAKNVLGAVFSIEESLRTLASPPGPL